MPTVEISLGHVRQWEVARRVGAASATLAVLDKLFERNLIRTGQVFHGFATIGVLVEIDIERQRRFGQIPVECQRVASQPACIDVMTREFISHCEQWIGRWLAIELS